MSWMPGAQLRNHPWTARHVPTPAIPPGAPVLDAFCGQAALAVRLAILSEALAQRWSRTVSLEVYDKIVGKDWKRS